MKSVLLVIAVLASISSIGQTTPGIKTMEFYDALNRGDSLGVLDFLSEDVMVKHFEEDTSFEFNLSGFMTICPKFKTGYFREDFKIIHENGYPGVDIVEVYFEFYLDGEFRYCGTDMVFWEHGRIARIYSYVDECDSEWEDNKWEKDNLLKLLEDQMNKWHLAAAKANLHDYFEFMADDFYYLGTDPSERWNKEQFKNFCKPYFDKGQAWTFKATERNFYFSDDMSVVWFDEKLNTWMEGCRGSGVLELQKWSNGSSGGDYKLKHYNLTVTIENEKIQDFIKLRKQ
ncbi:MAG: nuclear transport factor 2 family protein [Crocinitomicaceae bacterium]|nr:nuclear transport factor 2 family protein [Crocinitomicaceae bacterium]